MSFFGKNIRKIRSVKSLSQQSFADLFELKRGTLGAYEEGRSEPKIETIIRIANHFSIPIDDLLTTELTVNNLLKFQGNLITNHEELEKKSFPAIPCITQDCIKDYISYYDKETFVKNLPCLHLPVETGKQYRGYTVDNLEMSNSDKGLFPKDVIIGAYVPASQYKKMDNAALVLVLAQDQLIFRRMYISKDTMILRAEHKNVEEINVDIKEVKELWQVKYVFYHRLPEIGNGIEEKLLFLEQEFAKLKSSL